MNQPYEHQHVVLVAEIERLRTENAELRTQLDAAGDGDTWNDACKRVEAEVERLHAATEKTNEAFNEMLAFKDAQINQLRDQLVSERSGLAKVIDQRDTAREEVTTLRGLLRDAYRALREVQFDDEWMTRVRAALEEKP